MHNVSYTASLSAAGGTAPYAWSISDGALPQGLTLTPEGTIAGIPSANGAYHFSITVMDASRQTTTATYAITVLDPLTITTHGPLTAAIGQPANISLSATGGIQPYTWSISSGALPQDLTLSPIGMISGTPTQSTSSSITLSVRDSAQPISIASASIVLITASLLAVSTRTLPPANQRIPYQAALQASGGTPPYTWSISSGALAPGLNLAPDGLITGTPSTVGTYPFGVTLQDATGQQTDATIACTVTPLTVITTTLPQGTAGAPYIAAVEARGGLPPYSWTAAGSLPKGLSFTADGIITGTAAATGTFELTITAADQANATASASLVLTIITPFGGHLQFGAIASPSLATQLPISLTLDTPAPIDLTGSIDIQFQADQASREDSSVLFISTASRSVSFTVPKGSNSAHFAQPALLNTGTTAGTITLTGQLSASPGSTTTTAIRLAPTPPVITGAQILSHDAYTLTIEVTGYSPTTEVTTAQFAFAGLPTQRDLTIPVQDLFAAWYHSGGAADGTFRYTQRFNFTGDSRDLSRLTIALTNTVGQSQSYTLTF
jgi:hypothetical protein